MSGEEPTIYWDACVLLAWLNEEDRPAGEMEGVHGWAKEVYAGDAQLLTSTLVRTEVLDPVSDEDAREAFEGFLDRPNVTEIDVHPPISREAQRIRAYYGSESRPTVCTPDAIHLASAIVYEADEFHTFDRNDTDKCRGLLPLSGNVAGVNLTICKPQPEQGMLL